jgi:hypothetical protein
MAGSLNHIVDDDGYFTMQYIDDLGDAHEALEECFEIIHKLTGGKMEKVNPILDELFFPPIQHDMVSELRHD